METVPRASPPPGADGVREFEAVMSAHETALLRYAARFLNDPAAAQDVVQEVFLKLYRYWNDAARPTEQLKSWLFRVTHNAAVDHLRRETRLRTLHQKQAAEAPPKDPEPAAQPLERKEAVNLALAHIQKLDPPEREVVILRLQEGLSYKEISAVTGRTEGNVGCILHHAIKKLAAGLKQAGAV